MVWEDNNFYVDFFFGIFILRNIITVIMNAVEYDNYNSHDMFNIKP